MRHTTKTSLEMNRRTFLKGAAVASGSMVLGFSATGALAAETGSAPASAVGFNPFVKIDADGAVTVVCKHFEMGQGTTTGLTTLVAEELDVAWDQVSTEFSPSSQEFINLAFGGQGTGGSTAIANSFMQYRQAGAAARDMLVRAAAKEWNVAPADVNVQAGMLSSGDNKATIGQFVKQASQLEPLAEPPLKTADNFTLIGKNKLPRKDSVAKTTGTATFAMDVKVPNMVYVTVLTSPQFGGTLKSFDLGEAADVNGFVDAKALADKSGVAVYAESTWASIKARRAITAEWDNSAADVRGSADMLREYSSKLEADPAYDATGKGDLAEVEAAAMAANKSVTADFHFPLLAHAPMEPLNCVIEPTEDGGIRVHDGCQFHMITHPTIAAITQLPPEKIDIITYYAGGSFGRRANGKSDYHTQAALAFVALGGKKAVKLVWTREDDLAGGFYRPMSAQRAHIGIGDDGKISAWGHRTVAQSIFKGGPMESMAVHNGVDHFSVEGIVDTPYQLPMSLGLTDYESPMPVLWWRSVGHSQSGYTMEVLMDMAAEAAGKDPVEFRLAHLDETNEDQARFAGVLKDNIVCAVDCGIAVNPDVVRAQMEGGIGYGLGAVMRNQVTLSDGVVEQGNFPQYKPLRITDMPNVEVHIVPSDQAPSGVGEPGLPPAGPALANAIYAATGKRVTKLPMESHGVKFV